MLIRSYLLTSATSLTEAASHSPTPLHEKEVNDSRKMRAHDDVTHGAMARMIFKKINDLATRIKLTL